jgi:hypothetical protein
VKGIAVRRTWTGSTVRHQPWQPRPTEVPSGALVIASYTDFHEYFEPLYPLLAGYPWLSEDLRFAPPPAWYDGPYDPDLDRYGSAQWNEFWSHLVAEDRGPERRAVWAPGFLERYARFLSDDWCSIIGVPGPASGDLLEASRGIMWPQALDVVRADVAFVNVDAAYWEVFSSRADILDIVRRHLAHRSDLRLVDVLSEESP